MDAWRLIEEWGKGLKPWQRKALTLASRSSNATAEEIAALAVVAVEPDDTSGQREAGVGEESAEGSQQSAAAERGPDGQPPLLLDAIHSPRRVNALDDAAHLTFAAKGLTVVYGDNGSGKSGFARILKRACRSRHQLEQVLPNVFRIEGGPASATIEFTLGTDRCQLAWQDDSPAPQVLQRISIFDAYCADVYVDDEHDVAYMPEALRALDRLAKLYGQVAAELRGRETAITAAAPRWPDRIVDTPTQVALERLAIGTDVTSAPAFMWADADKARLDTLEATIARLRGADPAARLAELDLLSARVRDLIKRCADLEEKFNDTSLTELRRVHLESQEAEAAATAASALAFGSEPLPGVGSSVWRLLWESARRYSSELAYPAGKFPVIGDDARCVLCQQPLATDAKERLTRFAQYVADDSARRATNTEAFLKSKTETVRGTSSVTCADLQTRAALRARTEAVFGSVQAFLRAVRRRKVWALRSLEGPPADPAPALPAPPDALLRASLTGIEAEQAELRAAIATNALPALEAEARALEARRWAAENVEQIRAEVARLSSLAKVRAALAEADTSAVTRKSTELTDRLVTEALAKRFATELQALGGAGIKAALLKKQSRRGVTYHHVRLVGTAREATVGAVASEGEQRVVALSAYLAEVTDEEQADPIVLDDPVSSLDHVRRAAVATRLVELAKVRQVIVFTHDVVFVTELVEEAAARGVDCAPRRVERSSVTSGHTRTDLPWIAATSKDRVASLRERAVRAKVLESGDPATYAAFARETYGLLREAWERGVEELLLNGAIVRFRKSVETKRLGRVCEDLTAADYEVVERAMAKCSVHLSGHDSAVAANPIVPRSDELSQDVEAFAKWRADMARRR